MYTERSPLTGQQPTYSYQNPSRLYKKQVKQFQCLLCAGVLAIFSVALITAIVFSVDEDELDNMINRNASLEGKLQAASPGSSPKPIKLYTSGTVVKGMASGGFDDGSTSQIFTGVFPVTIHLDPIIDPDAPWSPSVDLTWSGQVVNNDSIKGTFSLPVKVPINETEIVEVKTFKGEFEIQMAFKWSSNLDIVIPNKVYNCKAIFQASYKSSMSDNSVNAAKAVIKGKTDPSKEICSVMFQGNFYEKSFFCYITPWFCTDEKLFYWNGGLEFKITKPAPKPTIPPPSPNSLRNGNTERVILKSGLKAAPEDTKSITVGSKILGTVANGWLTIIEDSGTSRNIWNGELPCEIPMPILMNLQNGMKDSSGGKGVVTWSSSVFSNSLRGSFKLPQYNGVGAQKWMSGSFFFLLESNPSIALSSALESGVDYTSTLGFKESSDIFNGTQIIDFNIRNISTSAVVVGYNAPIVLLGKNDKVRKMFMWDGRFEMIPKRILKNQKIALKSPPDMLLHPDNQIEPATDSKSALKSSLNAWHTGEPIGSKLIGKVSSGWMSIEENSGTKTIWNGELPKEITLPMFFNPTTNFSDLSHEYGQGATWSCSVFHSSLRGSFRLPQYTRFGLVKWLKGSFFFQLDSDPSWSLYDAIYPGITYNSPIHFHNSDKSYNGSKLIQFYSHDKWGSPAWWGWGGESEYKAILILMGRSKKASKSFSWDGKFEMIVKKYYRNPNNYLEKSSKSLDEAKPHSVTVRPGVISDKDKTGWESPDQIKVGSKLLGKISSGWMTLTSDSGTTTIWNGELPARISFPLFFDGTNNRSGLSDDYGHGVLWSSSVFHSAIRGSFKLPQYTKFGLVKWLKGSFFFQLESSPDWSLYDAVVPGIDYYSPLHFRDAKKDFNDTKLINFFSSTQTSPFDDLGYKAPIALFGQSQGKEFFWDGRFIIVNKKLY